LGWNEWLIIIAVLLFALKIGYDEILKRFFGKKKSGLEDSHVSEMLASRTGSDTGKAQHSMVADHGRTVASGEIHPHSHNDRSPIHITNIEIHDSVINRSTILPDGDDDKDKDDNKDDNTTDNYPGDIAIDLKGHENRSSVAIEGSVVRRSKISDDSN